MTDLRIHNLIQEIIQKQRLCLEGLTVFTEAATGPYKFNPIIAALSGANKVYAFANDSKFASKYEVKRTTMEEVSSLKLNNIVEVIFDKNISNVGESDIFTNSGFVRPIDGNMVSMMKSTAVVSLMWEPWEFRKSDIDIRACQKKDVLVLGTHESSPNNDMYGYSGYLAMKLLFNLGLEGYKTNILLLGGDYSLGEQIYNHFTSLNMQIAWFSNDNTRSRRYEELASIYCEKGKQIDAIIVADHSFSGTLIGKKGILTPDIIKNINPAVKIGVISGVVAGNELSKNGIAFTPKEIRPFGFMSYQAYDLGPRPVLELFAAGLKVGETMARARLSGMNIEESAQHSIKNSAAQDLLGELSWLD